MTKEYLFRDTDLAAARLKVLAEVFAPSSRAFLAAAVPPGPALAVDLGCGPGCTTHLLAETLACQRVCGLDNSERFIALASKTATDRVRFHLHDVAVVPLPVGSCDLIYGRFLLTHQKDPAGLIAGWAGQLSAGGRLLLEEVDSIHTANTTFVPYLRIVAAMLADGGGELYVGPRLDAMQPPAGLVRCSSRAFPVPVQTHLAARLFQMNIQTWRHNAFVGRNYSPATIRQLAEKLTDLAARETNEKGIEWRLRQLVYERPTSQQMHQG